MLQDLSYGTCLKIFDETSTIFFLSLLFTVVCVTQQIPRRKRIGETRLLEINTNNSLVD